MGSRATQPRKRLGVWNAAFAHSTIYQAATDGWAVAFCVNQNTGGADMYIQSDGATPPTVARCAEGISVDPGTFHVDALIRKNDYWRVVRSGASAVTVIWLPLEP